MYFNCTLIKYTNYKNKNYDIFETVGKLNLIASLMILRSMLILLSVIILWLIFKRVIIFDTYTKIVTNKMVCDG